MLISRALNVSKVSPSKGVKIPAIVEQEHWLEFIAGHIRANIIPEMEPLEMSEFIHIF